MSAFETIKEQLCHLEAAEIAEVERLIRDLRNVREKQKATARATMGMLRGSATSVDEFLRTKHAAGERW